MTASAPLALDVRGVDVVAGGRAILRGVDLAVRPGERVAVVGPSGAGKTTLLHLLGATRAPDAGVVEVLGVDPATARPGVRRDVQRRIGRVHQQLDLVGPLRVVHNVNAGRLGSWSTWRALRSLVRPVDVGSVSAALERVGLADRLHERTDRLSGGEQQRVALARVLVQRPDLVLADEPVASLDPERAREVVALLTDLAGELGTTLVVSLHAFDLARHHCDRVVGLRDGRIAFDEPAAGVDQAQAAALYRIDDRSR